MKVREPILVREERNRLVNAIARYMRGEIDNFEFDDISMGVRWTDTSVQRIAADLWCTYDEVKRHSVNVTWQGWQMYRRCHCFFENGSVAAGKASDWRTRPTMLAVSKPTCRVPRSALLERSEITAI